MDTPTQPYEERFGPVERRLRRIRRGVAWRTKAMLGRPRSLLVEIRWRLGDEVMAIPVYEALKQRYPSSHLTVLCNYPGLLRDNPHVDAVNAESASPDKYLLLRGAPRDVFRPEQYARLAGVLTKPPVDATAETLGLSAPRVYCENWHSPLLDELAGLLADQAGGSAPPVHEDALPERPEPAWNGPAFLAVCTGATWPTKRWPPALWRELCRRLADDGWHLVQLGRGDEDVGAGVSLIDRTTIEEAACILRAARLLICCDSGLMHLARAVGTPAVALFGPTDPSILIRDDPGFHALTNGRLCKGCWNIREGLPGRPRMEQEGVCPVGIAECMETLTVDAVLARVGRVLQKGP